MRKAGSSISSSSRGSLLCRPLAHFLQARGTIANQIRGKTPMSQLRSLCINTVALLQDHDNPSSAAAKQCPEKAKEKRTLVTWPAYNN